MEGSGGVAFRAAPGNAAAEGCRTAVTFGFGGQTGTGGSGAAFTFGGAAGAPAALSFGAVGAAAGAGTVASSEGRAPPVAKLVVWRRSPRRPPPSPQCLTEEIIMRRMSARLAPPPAPRRLLHASCTAGRATPPQRMTAQPRWVPGGGTTSTGHSEGGENNEGRRALVKQWVRGCGKTESSLSFVEAKSCVLLPRVLILVTQ